MYCDADLSRMTLALAPADLDNARALAVLSLQTAGWETPCLLNGVVCLQNFLSFLSSVSFDFQILPCIPPV